MSDEMREARVAAFREWWARPRPPQSGANQEITAAYWAGFEAGWDRRADSPAPAVSRLLAAAKEVSRKYNHTLYEEWIMDNGMGELDAAIAEVAEECVESPAAEMEVDRCPSQA